MVSVDTPRKRASRVDVGIVREQEAAAAIVEQPLGLVSREITQKASP